jgi:hypothetical protein
MDNGQCCFYLKQYKILRHDMLKHTPQYKSDYYKIRVEILYCLTALCEGRIYNFFN